MARSPTKNTRNYKQLMIKTIMRSKFTAILKLIIKNNIIKHLIYIQKTKRNNLIKRKKKTNVYVNLKRNK